MQFSKINDLTRAVRLRLVMDLAKALGVPAQVHQSYFTETKGSKALSVDG